MQVKLSLIDLMLLRDGLANIPGAPTDWYDGRWELHAKVSPTKEGVLLGEGKTLGELAAIEVEREMALHEVGKLQTVMQRCEWSPLVGDYAPPLKRKLAEYADRLEAEELWRRRFPGRPLPGDNDADS